MKHQLLGFFGCKQGWQYTDTYLLLLPRTHFAHLSHTTKSYHRPRTPANPIADNAHHRSFALQRGCRSSPSSTSHYLAVVTVQLRLRVSASPPSTFRTHMLAVWEIWNWKLFGGVGLFLQFGKFEIESFLGVLAFSESIATLPWFSNCTWCHIRHNPRHPSVIWSKPF